MSTQRATVRPGCGWVLVFLVFLGLGTFSLARLADVGYGRPPFSSLFRTTATYSLGDGHTLEFSETSVGHHLLKGGQPFIHTGDNRRKVGAVFGNPDCSGSTWVYYVDGSDIDIVFDSHTGLVSEIHVRPDCGG